MSDVNSLRYKRVCLKLSGEAMSGRGAFGIDIAVVNRLARDVGEAVQAGVRIVVVLGGGNIFRGLAGAAKGMDRATADYMGMLATVMNALAFHNALERQGTPARVLSAIPMPTICESYVRAKALHHLENGRVVICAAGTGNPFFTTDTTAALRAIEMNCDAVAKATQVDGVYSADPRTDPTAVRYDRLTYADVLARDLKVMDGAAVALARDNGLPIIVFSIEESGNLLKMLRGEARATIVQGSV
ncbi:MAG TPA: UMP kinase [Hyphomicrobiaceae bacterium]|jgi:uridylate kinase|nr:UMP kinase [Hyphomicrobiaceae bacterium]